MRNDELYHSSVYYGKEISDDLYHYKYISKYKSKTGKWVYAYKKVGKGITDSVNGVKEYANYKKHDKKSKQMAREGNAITFKSREDKALKDFKVMLRKQMYANSNEERRKAAASLNKYRNSPIGKFNSSAKNKINKGKSWISKIFK